MLSRSRLESRARHAISWAALKGTDTWSFSESSVFQDAPPEASSVGFSPRIPMDRPRKASGSYDEARDCSRLESRARHATAWAALKGRQQEKHLSRRAATPAALHPDRMEVVLMGDEGLEPPTSRM